MKFIASSVRAEGGFSRGGEASGVSTRRVRSHSRRLAGFVFLALLFFSPSAFAGVNVIGSLSRRMELAPGDEFQGRVIVRNPSDSPQTVRVYLKDYQSFSDGTSLYDEPGTHPRSNSGWVHLIPGEQEIPPKDSASFHFIVRAPEEELSGTYWSMLMVEPVSPSLILPGEQINEERGFVGIRAVMRTGIHIITNILDTGARDVRFSGRELESENGRLFFRLNVENTGERILDLDVWAELFDADGISIGRFEAGRRGLYPGSCMRRRVEITGVPPGEYRLLVIADNGDDYVFGARYELGIPEDY